LIISFSPKTNPSFRRVEFDCDVLFVGERGGAYYVRDLNVLATAMANFIRQQGYRKIMMLGGSKAGFGALNMMGHCAKLAPARNYKSIVFSPQALVYPRTDPLSFQSHRDLMKRAEQDARLKHDLERYGRLPRFDHPNASAIAYVGNRNLEDMAECRKLQGKNVEIREMPLTTHLSHLPFIVDKRNTASLRKIVTISNEQNQAIERTVQVQNSERDISEILAMPEVPMLRDLVEEEFDVMPEQPVFQKEARGPRYLGGLGGLLNRLSRT